jgi:hypothetical protein
VNKENRNNTTGANQPVSLKKTGVVSSSHSSSTKQRKTQEKNCVAYSFDDSMIDKLTEVPAGTDRNEWLATHSKFFVVSKI